VSKPLFAVIECEYRNDLGTYRLAFAPDGRSIVGFLTEMGRHKGIARWDASTGKLLESRKEKERGHADIVTSSSDARAVAVSHFGETVEIRDGATLKSIATLKTQACALAWSHDGQLLVTASAYEVKCWKALTGRQLASITLNPARERDNIKFVAFGSGGREILLGQDSGVATWEFAKGKVNRHLRFNSRDGWFWQH